MLSFSQGIWFSVGQDARLAFDSDDGHGNSAFTPDVYIGLELRIRNNKDKPYFYFMRPEFEYADLAGGVYKRFGSSFGITFQEWVRNFDFTTALGYGLLIRHKLSGLHAVSTFQLGYNVNSWLILFMEGELMQRRDLSNTTIGYSTRGGIKIKLK